MNGVAGLWIVFAVYVGWCPGVISSRTSVHVTNGVLELPSKQEKWSGIDNNVIIQRLDSWTRIVQISHPPPDLSHNALLPLSASLTRSISSRPDGEVQPAAQMSVLDGSRLAVLGWIRRRDQATRLL